MSYARIPAVAPLALALPTAIGASGATLAAGLNPAAAALAYSFGIGAFLLAGVFGASRAERRAAPARSSGHG